MARDRETRERDGGQGPGPAYPARYARLGGANLATPGRRAILGVGGVLLVALIALAIVAS